MRLFPCICLKEVRKMQGRVVYAQCSTVGVVMSSYNKNSLLKARRKVNKYCYS